MRREGCGRGTFALCLATTGCFRQEVGRKTAGAAGEAQCAAQLSAVAPQGLTVGEELVPAKYMPQR